jgi:hypothetical protein
MKQRVENEIYLLKDSNGSVINTDKSGYASIIESKNRRAAAIDSVNRELDALRQLVNSLLEERANNGSNRSSTV